MAKLSISESTGGFTHSLKFDYLDLQATGFLSTVVAANQRIIGSLPAGGIIDLVAVVNTVADAGATDLTLDVGVTGADPDDFIDNLDLDGLTYCTANTGDQFIGTDSGSATTSNVLNCYVNNTTSAKTIYMELNGTVGNLTAGEWVIAWRQADIASLA